MTKQKVLIIDDESPAREIIKLFLRDYEEFEVCGEAENGFEGIQMIKKLAPDLIFLDIQMPKLTGFEMLELVDDMPKVIFSQHSLHWRPLPHQIIYNAKNPFEI